MVPSSFENKSVRSCYIFLKLLTLKLLNFTLPTIAKIICIYHVARQLVERFETLLILRGKKRFINSPFELNETQ